AAEDRARGFRVRRKILAEQAMPPPQDLLDVFRMTEQKEAESRSRQPHDVAVIPRGARQEAQRVAMIFKEPLRKRESSLWPRRMSGVGRTRIRSHAVPHRKDAFRPSMSSSNPPVTVVGRRVVGVRCRIWGPFRPRSDPSLKSIS